jgi:hypothetical protein
MSSPNPLDQLEFVQPAPRDVVLCDLDGLHEWRFLSPQWHVVETDPSLSTSRRQYSELHLDLVAKRVYNYYLYNIALVVFLIASLSVLSFCIELEDLANRTSITLTLLLTSVAFKITLSEKLPNVAYLTLLDQYILWSLGMYMCMCMSSVIVEYSLSSSVSLSLSLTHTHNRSINQSFSTASRCFKD